MDIPLAIIVVAFLGAGLISRSYLDSLSEKKFGKARYILRVVILGVVVVLFALGGDLFMHYLHQR